MIWNGFVLFSVYVFYVGFCLLLSVCLFFFLSQDVVILFTLMSLNVPRVSFDKESYSTILPNSTHVLRHNAINRNRK